MVFKSGSPDETALLGARLAGLLEAGDFVALQGDLGAGKTRFAQGVAVGLGVDPSLPVTSPTYTLMNIYTGRLKLYHFDLYRLAGDGDAVELGFTSYFSGDGVSLVEWPERLTRELPEERIDVLFSHVDESVRIIDMLPSGARFREVVAKLSSMHEK